MDVGLNSRGEAEDQQGKLPSDRDKQGISLEKEEMESLSTVVWEGYQIDVRSLSTETKCWDECKKLVSMLPDSSSRNGRFDGAANINLPVVLNAAIVFNARAYPAFFPANDIVKCEVIGDDSGLGIPGMNPQTGQIEMQKWILEPGAKEKRATRISQHMSWQLTYKMPNWVEDTDRMLLLNPIYGCLFKKTYYNSYTKTNCSELIMPQFLVVHNETRDLASAPRVTHSYGLYPYEIQERIRSGYFKEFNYDNDDSGEQHEFLEQHLRYDLDGDGYDEPLIATLHSETKSVVRVEKRYIDSDVTRKNGKVIRIEAENFFVKIPFVPNPTGSFYDIGIGYILYQISKALNTTVNQLLDAGTLGNSPFFLLEKGRMKGGEVKVRPGFGLFVNNDSRPLRDSIYQMDFHGPDAVLFQLLGFLFEYARNLGGMREILEGAVRSDQAAGSTEMLIQEGMNEYKAIYKRIRRALGHEFKRLFELNSRYLDEEEYFKVLDTQEGDGGPGRVNIFRKDYNKDDYDVCPIADAEYLTSAQKKAKSERALALASANLVNPKVATKMVLQAENFDNIDELLDFEPTNQELALQQQKMELERAATEVQGKEAQAAILKEQNAKRKLDIEEAKALYSIDETKSKIVKNLAEAEKASEESDLGALELIAEREQRQNEKRLAEISAAGSDWKK